MKQLPLDLSHLTEWKCAIIPDPDNLKLHCFLVFFFFFFFFAFLFVCLFFSAGRIVLLFVLLSSRPIT